MGNQQNQQSIPHPIDSKREKGREKRMGKRENDHSSLLRQPSYLEGKGMGVE